MLYYRTQARVRQQILQLWRLLWAAVFSVTGKVLVIQERAKLETFLCLTAQKISFTALVQVRVRITYFLLPPSLTHWNTNFLRKNDLKIDL
jgi:hypothetical protein